MALEGLLYKRLREALTNHFQIAELGRMTREDLSMNPELIWPPDALLDSVVERLLAWAERQERMLDLVEAASVRSTASAVQTVVMDVRAALASRVSVAVVIDKPARHYETLAFVIEGDELRKIDSGPTRPVPVDSLTLDTARVFNRWHAARTLARENDIRVFGEHLFKILFGSSPGDGQTEMLRALALRCKQVQDNKNSYLRLMLQFKNKDSELARFPWEFLYIPRGALFLAPRTQSEAGEWWPPMGFFLTKQERITLTRTPPQTEQRPPGEPPLRVLVVDSRGVAGDRDPDDAEDLAMAWRNEPDLSQIKFGTLVAPSRAQLQRMLQQKLGDEFQVVHFIGHGLVNDGDDYLRLSDQHGLSQTQIGDDLQQVRLVVLQVARAPQKQSYEVFVRMAMNLMELNRLSTVVAMQLDGASCLKFTAEFYRSLLRCEPIEVAIQNARGTLGIDRGEFGSPIILLKSWGAIIREAPAANIPVDQIRGGRLEPVVQAEPAPRSRLGLPNPRDSLPLKPISDAFKSLLALRRDGQS